MKIYDEKMLPERALRPTAGVAARIEELLREELYEFGEDVAELTPESFTIYMQCELEDDGGMTYIWRDTPILRVQPEADDDSVTWRMFTRELDI